jgi:hypothetical protein
MPYFLRLEQKADSQQDFCLPRLIKWKHTPPKDAAMDSEKAYQTL